MWAKPRKGAGILLAIIGGVWILSCTPKAPSQAPLPHKNKDKGKDKDKDTFRVLDNAETLSRWTGTGALDKLTLRDKRKEGKKSIGFNKTGVKEDWVRCALELDRTMDMSGCKRFSCWIYIDDPTPIKQVTFWFGNTIRWGRGYIFTKQGKDLVAGWNYIDESIFHFSGYGGNPDWRKIRNFSIEVSTYEPTDTFNNFLVDDVRLWPGEGSDITAPVQKLKDNPFLIVDGKPFFPIGVYGMPYDASDAEWREVASLGINMVTSDESMLSIPQWLAFLDKAHSYGIKVAVGLIYPAKDVWSSWWATDFNKKTFRKIGTIAERKAFLRKLVTALKDHPALVAWDTCDEISQYGVEVEGLLAGYKFVKKLDPKHPVWLNHPSSVLNVRKLAHYNQIADVVSLDIYPVPTEGNWSNLPDKTISSVGDYTMLTRRSVNYQKPVWMVLQAYKLNPDECATGRFPTLREFRFMTYDSIVYGTRGIVYFLYLRRKAEYPRWTLTSPYTPEFWVAMKSVLLELKELQPALLVNDSRPGPEITSPQRSVKGIIKKVKGKSYLICLNRSPKPAEAVQIRIPGRTFGKAAVVFEGRWATVEKGAIVDNFDGYGVHVYVVKNEESK